MYKFLVIVGILALYGSFTNVVPISALPCMFFFLVPFILYTRGVVNNVVFAGILLLGYFFLSVLVYDWPSLVEYDFYRYDGNAFVSMMPLIVLGCVRHHFLIKKIIRRFIYIATLINFVFMIIYILTGGTFVATEEGVYHFLFKAHNAAGGYLMIVTAICFGIYIVKRENKYLVCLILNFIGLLLTDSRGSLLGLFFGIIALYCKKNNRLKYLLSFAVITQLIMYSCSYYFAPDNYMSVNLMTVDGFDYTEDMHRGGTFINRFFYLWPRAIFLFLQSPLLGTGFGSYDDWPYEFIGGYGLIVNESIIVHSDFHAHNSYLNILAETGMVGMLLFLNFVRQIHKFLIELAHENLEMSYALTICMWAAMASAITEHRIFAPAQMLPFYIILGITISYANRTANN